MCPKEKPLHIVTPLLRSAALTELLPGCEGVYLKMENCQIAGSFKIRGFGRLAQKLKGEGYEHFVAATTGNTGSAVAYAAQLLGVPCTAYIPETSPSVCSKRLKQCGAEVKVIGHCFNDTQKFAVEYAKKPGVAYVNPSHPEIWLGQDVLVAMETHGTDCFSLSIKANKMVALDEITSIAKSLGSRTVDPHLLEIMPQFNIISEVVSDEKAIESCIRFSDDECTIVEPGCGAALAAVYSGVLAKLHSRGQLPDMKSGPVVVIVCGGRSVSLQLLQQWSKEFNVPFPTPQKDLNNFASSQNQEDF